MISKMKLKLATVTVATFLLASCGATWINLDDTKADLERINEAKAKCNHDGTLLKLQSKKLAKNAKVAATSSVAEKKSLEEEYAAEEKKVYAELNACMAKQGLKPLR